MKPTAKSMILNRLAQATGPLAVHEFGFLGHSQISMARRLYEMQKEGLVSSADRPGTAFKEWRLKEVLTLEG